jgi:hypothetical protein
LNTDFFDSELSCPVHKRENKMNDPFRLKKNELSVPCVYFQEPGPGNSRRTLEAAARRAEDLDVQNILLSSTSGKTGLAALDYFKNRNLIVVTHATGFLRPDHQQLRPELRDKIEKGGARILTCQHALGGVGRAVRKKLGSYQIDEMFAYTLRLFGEGTKVAVEIALMAADAGFVSTREPCVSMGGTGQGIDTALLLRPSHAQDFFDLQILEILAKPRLVW